MKRKILYIGAVAIISLTSFIIGRNSVERSGTKQKERSHDYDNSRKIFSRLYV
jgi:hypothetical protein